MTAKLGEAWLNDIEEQRKNRAKFTSEWIQIQYQVLQDLAKPWESAGLNNQQNL